MDRDDHIDVKICGLTDAAAVAAAAEAGADMIGFVFFPPSPRHVEPAHAAELAAGLSGATGERTRTVGLTVDADDQTLDSIFQTFAPDILQLHGHESPDRVAVLKSRYRVPVMKAFPIAVSGDLAAVEPYLGLVDRLLFDARPPAGATRPGGLGRAFDWTLLAGLDLPLPVMLSGGLDADAVGRAIAIAGPGGVDVSSGVESAPGIKDPAEVRRFVAAVRAAEASRSRPLERMPS